MYTHMSSSNRQLLGISPVNGFQECHINVGVSQQRWHQRTHQLSTSSAFRIKRRVVSGCFWMFLDVSGCFWMFLDVSGCFWITGWWLSTTPLKHRNRWVNWDDKIRKNNGKIKHVPNQQSDHHSLIWTVRFYWESILLIPVVHSPFFQWGQDLRSL